MAKSPLIYDAHRDVAYDALYFGRDYRWSVGEARARAKGSVVEKFGPSTTGFEEAMHARIALVNATIFVEPKDYVPWGSVPHDTAFSRVYETPAEARSLALEQLHYYRRLVDETGQIRLIRTQKDLASVLATWSEDADPAKAIQGLVLLLEGADPIQEPEEFEYWFDQGIRIVGPAWSRTRYAGGTNAPGPLTEMGIKLLKYMSRFKAILDLSHLSELSCLQALDRYEGGIIASHSNPKRFCNTDRHLSDQAIRLLAQRRGVLGITLLSFSWDSSWKPGVPVPLSRVGDAIDHVCQLTGSAGYVGLGTDFWAGDGADNIIDELDSCEDLPKIAQLLQERGFSSADVGGIMHGNMLRVLSENLPPT